jgi:hypothetical protein
LGQALALAAAHCWSGSVLAAMALQDPTCPVVKNIILLDSEGRRIAVKYFSPEW